MENNRKKCILNKDLDGYKKDDIAEIIETYFNNNSTDADVIYKVHVPTQNIESIAYLPKKDVTLIPEYKDNDILYCLSDAGLFYKDELYLYDKGKVRYIHKFNKKIILISIANIPPHIFREATESEIENYCNYNVGDYQYCIEDVRMCSDNTIEFTKGKLYLSETKDCLTNNSGNKYHGIGNDTFYFRHFRKATHEEIIEHQLANEPKKKQYGYSKDENFLIKQTIAANSKLKSYPVDLHYKNITVMLNILATALEQSNNLNDLSVGLIAERDLIKDTFAKVYQYQKFPNRNPLVIKWEKELGL